MHWKVNVQLLKGAVDGLNGFLVRISHSIFVILVMYFITLVFRSNTFRICSIRFGGIQNHYLLFRQNYVKRAEVTHYHFIAWEYCVFLRVSFYIILLYEMSKVLLPRVACVLVFNNLMVIVSPPGDKY